MATEQTAEKSIAAVNINRKDKACEPKEKLADLLSTAVNETVKQIFKEAGAKVIFDFIEKQCHLKLEEIVEKPEVFSAGLERLTVSAASVIEKMILENLYSKLNLKFVEKDGYEFSDYIKELRRNMEVEG
jgi:ribonuclease HII